MQHRRTLERGLAYYLALTDYRQRHQAADVAQAAVYAGRYWPLFGREAAAAVSAWLAGNPCEHATYLRMLAEAKEEGGASLPQPFAS
jgi:hypothetical protein